MRYELENIEQCLGRIVHDLSVLSATECEDLCELIQAIIRDLKYSRKSIDKDIISIDDRATDKLIRYHQTTVVRMLDLLSDFTKGSLVICSTVWESIGEVFRTLEQYHHFLRTAYTQYFDYRASVYRCLKDHFFNEILVNWEVFKNKVERLTREHALAAIISQPLEEFISSDPDELSHYKMNFLFELQNQVAIWSTENIADDSESLCRFFCLINYNSPAVFHYLTNNILNAVSNRDWYSSKLNGLVFYSRYLDQMELKPYLSYDWRSPTLAHQLQNWVREEILFTERGTQLCMDQKVAENHEFKLCLDLSVSQLAYFIRILQGTGIIQNKNISELIKYFSATVKTKRSENISFESLRIKFYNVEGSTKDFLKNVSKKMVSYIDTDL